MASRIEHRATFGYPVADVLTADSGEEALRARLAEIGGKDARLASYTAGTGDVRFTLLQSVAAEQLPQAVRALHSGDLVVKREHTWSGSGEHYTGTITARVSGIPGEITARTELTADAADGGRSVLTTRGEVKVPIPIVGGKLEGFIADQVTGLLKHEAEFTASWLARQG